MGKRDGGPQGVTPQIDEPRTRAAPSDLFAALILLGAGALMIIWSHVLWDLVSTAAVWLFGWLLGSVVATAS
jgi:hypothetical protein